VWGSAHALTGDRRQETIRRERERRPVELRAGAAQGARRLPETVRSVNDRLVRMVEMGWFSGVDFAAAGTAVSRPKAEREVSMRRLATLPASADWSGANYGRRCGRRSR
jgi:hypothetical protein